MLKDDVILKVAYRFLHYPAPTANRGAEDGADEIGRGPLEPEWRSGALELQCCASQKVYGTLALFSGEFGVHIHLN